MSKVDRYLKAKEGMDYQSTSTGRTAAFVTDCGDVLIMEGHCNFDKKNAINLAYWILEIYRDAEKEEETCLGCNRLKSECTGQFPVCRNGLPGSIDAQDHHTLDAAAMMTEIRDKHFKIEKGDE